MSEQRIRAVGSRDFGEGTSARYIIAETLSRRSGFDWITPWTWAQAGSIVKDLRAEGFALRRTRP